MFTVNEIEYIKSIAFNVFALNKREKEMLRIYKSVGLTINTLIE